MEGGINMDNRLEVCNIANKIQNDLIEFVNKVNQFGIGCISRNIEIDGSMLIFHEEKTWKKFVDVFDILGMDFTSGEPDGGYNTWYIDFEFSDGVSN